MTDIQITKLECEGLNNPLGIDRARPGLSWLLTSRQRGQKQTAYRILVASSRKLLARNRGDLWDSGKVQSSQSRDILYSGQKLASRANCFWKVRIWDTKDTPSSWSETAFWSTGLLRKSDWSAKWIGMPLDAGETTSPWLRKTFNLPGKPEAARAYVNVMGYFELYINGQKIGDDVLAPHVSDYSKRSFYVTHDVTPHLRRGLNCIAVWLGRGWYKKGLKWPVAHDGPVARIQLELRQGGSSKRVCSNSTWRTAPSNMALMGAWQYNDFGGERLDASRELPAWNLARFDDSHWHRAKVIPGIKVPARAQMLPPNRIVETVSVKSMKKTRDGDWLIEMKKALTGWFEIELPPAERGRIITLEFGDAWERNEKRIPFKSVRDGSELYSYAQRSEYIYRGKGKEVFRNRFNYASFQYVRITNLPHKPDRSKIRGLLITTDLPIASRFVCSDKTLTAIHDTMLYTLRCLMLGGYQVDCHSRERLGYGGDGHSSLETTLVMLRSDSLYRKWTDDWLDAQGPDGELPHTAPCPYRAGGGPFWCGFLAAASWRNYVHYGDIRLLQKDYPAIMKWMEFVERHVKGGLMQEWAANDMRNWYLGDWATPPDIDQKHDASVNLFCNCFTLYIMETTAMIADTIGKRNDARLLRRRIQKRRPIVHERFFNPTSGTYADGDEIDLVMPLMARVTPDNLRDTIFRKYVNELMVKNRGHLATGLSGTYMMIQYLQSIGRDDLIYAFASKTTMPSWGYMIENGATVIWEYWTGIRSRIHNCYNNIGSWFQQGLGGIRPDPACPGFEHIFIEPAILKGLTKVEARHDSIMGTVECKWRRTGKQVIVEVTIPVGATATVRLPSAYADSVRESGKSATEAEGVQPLTATDNYAAFDVLSGAYRFSFPDPNAR